MTEPIASRPPANVPIPHARDNFVPAYDGQPDTEDVNFSEMWGDPDKGMTFADLLDVINPLQHIPIISTIYRMVTGDTMSPGARLAGGILFGGVSGLLASGVVAAFEEASGSSVENHLIAMFDGDDPADETATAQVASAAPAVPADPATTTTPAPAMTAALAPATTAAPVNLAAASQLFTARQPAIVRPVAVAAPPQAMAMAKPETVAAPRTEVAARPAQTPAPAVGTLRAEADSAREARAERSVVERQRITETISLARNQQTALLIANLMPSASESLNSRDKDGSRSSHETEPSSFRTANTGNNNDAFRSHPFMLPPGASPEMVTRAMEQALNKYQQGLRTYGVAR
ncbi:MAG: hypothetical protein V3R85_10450 [Alphaproteobacteria bacterium]